MRILAAIVFALTLAGCQQPAPTNSPAKTADAQTSADSTPSQNPEGTNRSLNDMVGNKGARFFEPEVRDLLKQIKLHIATVCFTHLRNKADYENCLRKDVVATFDDSGQGQKMCAALTDAGKFWDCVVNGNAGLDALHRVGADLSTDAEYWVSRESMDDTLRRAIIFGAIEKCGGIVSSTESMACSDDWLRSRLDLPDALLKKCPPGPDDPARGACFGMAGYIRFVRDHLARSPGTSI